MRRITRCLKSKEIEKMVIGNKPRWLVKRRVLRDFRRMFDVPSREKKQDEVIWVCDIINVWKSRYPRGQRLGRRNSWACDIIIVWN